MSKLVFEELIILCLKCVELKSVTKRGQHINTVYQHSSDLLSILFFILNGNWYTF